jgi:SOS-response transcriptional repressor LexA
VKKAVQASKNAIESLQEALPNEQASDLVKEMSRAVRIQKLLEGENCPAKHLQIKGRMYAREQEHV